MESISSLLELSNRHSTADGYGHCYGDTLVVPRIENSGKQPSVIARPVCDILFGAINHPGLIYVTKLPGDSNHTIILGEVYEKGSP